MAKNELSGDAGEDHSSADVGERASQVITRRPFIATE